MESITKNKQIDSDILRIVNQAFHKEYTPEEVGIRELTEGFFNAAYEITLPDRTTILKIAPPPEALVMSYEKNMMKAEVDALKLVKAKTNIPVPKVLFYDDTHTLCASDYFFMNKVEGDNFFTLKSKGLISYENQNRIFKEAGQYNHEMNRITGTSFGYLGIPEKQGASWKEVFLAMIEEVLQDGERIVISLGVDYSQVWDLIRRASCSLEEVTQPQFVHWDMWDGNIFVKDGKITGIIDFERAMWADPLLEFYFRRHLNIKDFYQGYGENLREKAPVRALLYDVYLFLIMVVETKYRMYSDDWQYGFATKQLALAMDELKKLV